MIFVQIDFESSSNSGDSSLLSVYENRIVVRMDRLPVPMKMVCDSIREMGLVNAGASLSSTVFNATDLNDSQAIGGFVCVDESIHNKNPESDFSQHGLSPCPFLLPPCDNVLLETSPKQALSVTGQAFVMKKALGEYFLGSLTGSKLSVSSPTRDLSDHFAFIPSSPARVFQSFGTQGKNSCKVCGEPQLSRPDLAASSEQINELCVDAMGFGHGGQCRRIFVPHEKVVEIASLPGVRIGFEPVFLQCHPIVKDISMLLDIVSQSTQK